MRVGDPGEHAEDQRGRQPRLKRLSSGVLPPLKPALKSVHGHVHSDSSNVFRQVLEQLFLPRLQRDERFVAQRV
jgi:hypothetical protein